MENINKLKKDYGHMFGCEPSTATILKRLITSRVWRFIFIGRLSEKQSSFSLVFNLILHHYKEKYGLELNFSNIGGGIFLAHPFMITMNSKAVVGDNCTFFKGITIGSVRSGKRKGVPTIGNNVVLCTNSVVCGGISIGNDVLIAANAFVNFDVPDHSIVIGNPGIIKNKKDCSLDY